MIDLLATSFPLSTRFPARSSVISCNQEMNKPALHSVPESATLVSLQFTSNKNDAGIPLHDKKKDAAFRVSFLISIFDSR
jgi:hypothetical protein